LLGPLTPPPHSHPLALALLERRVASITLHSRCACQEIVIL
jgi:hypothetical protein